MEKETNKIEVLTVKESAPSAGNVFRTIAVILGLLLILVGVIMIVSIILILPGLGLFITGTVRAALNVPKKAVDCPACGLEVKVALKSKNMKCDHCETVTPIV